MTLSVVFRSLANHDLSSITLYVAQDSGVDRADAFVTRIEGRRQGLADFHEAGRVRPDLGPGLRTLAFERRVVIVYAISSDAVEIIRVLYGGRDIDALLSPDE